MRPEQQRQLRELADDVVRMPCGCSCRDCWSIRNDLAERALRILNEIESASWGMAVSTLVSEDDGA